MKKPSLSRDSQRRLKQTSAYYAGGGLGARSYDLVYGKAAAAAADFFVGYTDKFGAPVLELGAGTGLITWPVAEAGYDIVAIDFSATMLELAEYKQSRYTAAVAERITFIRADMVDLKLKRAFGTVIVPGSSFQHLTTRYEQQTALENIYAHLSPGGGLVLTLIEPDATYSAANGQQLPAVETFDDPASGHRIRRTLVARETDPSGQVSTETILIEQINQAGETVDAESTSWSLRWTHQHEMRDLIKQCGFEIEAQFSDFGFAPPGHGKEQIWIARRP